MAKKLNLAKLNKKKEEISEIEMTRINARNKGHQADSIAIMQEDCQCDHWITYEDNRVLKDPPIADCHCNIWMAFGMLWGITTLKNSNG